MIPPAGHAGKAHVAECHRPPAPQRCNSISKPPGALWSVMDHLSTGWREHETANATPMNMKRMRGRGGHRHGGGGGGGGGGQFRQSNHQPMNRNHVFDSNGPDMRLRGTAQQLFEKYLQLGRDATGAGDRVMAESYFQHAEHYFRILNAMAQAAQAQQGQAPRRQQNGAEGQEGGGEAEGGEMSGQPQSGGYEPDGNEPAEQRETVQ